MGGDIRNLFSAIRNYPADSFESVKHAYPVKYRTILSNLRILVARAPSVFRDDDIERARVRLSR